VSEGINDLKLNPAKTHNNEKIIIERRRKMPLCQEMFLNKSKKILRLSHMRKNINKNAAVIKIDEVVWMFCAEFNKTENAIIPYFRILSFL